MSRRRSSNINRCPGCLINKELCFCDQFPTIETRAHLSLIMHIKEIKLTSNTGRLATKSLTNSSTYIRGGIDQIDFSKVYSPKENHKQLFLYPCESSIELTQDYVQTIDSPIELVVPDATWRQAKKFYTREPIFSKMQAVHLKMENKSIYTLRKQKYEYGLCTLEAIAYALGIIESQTVQDQLLTLLKVMNDRTQEARVPGTMNLL